LINIAPKAFVSNTIPNYSWFVNAITNKDDRKAGLLFNELDGNIELQTCKEMDVNTHISSLKIRFCQR